MAKQSENPIKTLNEAIVGRCIPHGNFEKAFDRSMELLKLRDFGMPGSGIIIYGKSGVGKTTLTKAVLKQGTKLYGEDSVIRTQLTTGSTVKGMFAELLVGFGDPLAKQSSTKDLERRLVSTISERQCRLIIIDEVQHLIPGGDPSKKTIDNILNAFKILDETGVSFILSGMDSLMLLWNADPQIRSRFQTHFYLSHFVYPKDKSSWRKVVRRYINTIEEHGMQIDCQEFEDRCHAASGGAMRQLVLILTTAVVQAFKANSKTITAEHLHKAACTQIDSHDGLTDAFNVSMENVRQFSRYNETSRELAPIVRGMGEIFVT
ncbi:MULTISPECIES: AAA family ATPase [Methylophaga]|uniref:AAA family ATPase n=1 Tax=Methylophaga TaxID=40222 RepID=UPI00259D0AEC|nr:MULTISPECIES: TniB family NTP-binding protein [Methylophaga]WVI83989.1 TniB family NTP-binding protein [Methylophaga thalassica]